MRSIFARILLWFVGTVALAIVGFSATSWLFSSGRPRMDRFFESTQALQLEGARHAHAEGGPDGLRRYILDLDERFDARHHLVDSHGKDLTDGEDRSALLAQARPRPRPGGGVSVLGRDSEDGRFHLIILVRPPFGPWDLLPSFLWILFVVVMMGYVLAVHLARPLVGLRWAVERFGRGDLATRVGSARRDEIGDLARAFDRMAGRIETLLNAERRLLQDVSHELRSPLARLGFALELARTAGDRAAALNRARKEADRLAELVSQLLQLTRYEGDPLSQTMEKVALDDILRETVSDCDLEAKTLGCQVCLRVDGPVKVYGERELLRRAVENVVRNAIRHAPEGTTVDVGLSIHGGSARVLVRDRGPGVPEGLLGDIFEPFFRVEGDRGRASGGVGLGLSIAKRAVGVHRGEIRASNAGPGLAVSIDLPDGTLPVELRGGSE